MIIISDRLFWQICYVVALVRFEGVPNRISDRGLRDLRESVPETKDPQSLSEKLFMAEVKIRALEARLSKD